MVQRLEKAQLQRLSVSTWQLAELPAHGDSQSRAPLGILVESCAALGSSQSCASGASQTAGEAHWVVLTT